MNTHVRRGGRFGGLAFAGAFATSIVATSACKADDDGKPSVAACSTCNRPIAVPHVHSKTGAGTLGYGPPGVYPGFQGFGLGYHLGSGYGGKALGVGAEGGFPFYAGPGYPHPWPELNRFGRIEPFPFYGGPGGPTENCPNYYAPTGPLVVDRPVIQVPPEPGESDEFRSFGIYSGVLPYPETRFAPFATGEAPATTQRALATRPAAPSQPRSPGEGTSSLGIEMEPVASYDGIRGLKVRWTDPGSPAQDVGLLDGDIIRSANGYATESPGNLTWVAENAAPDRVIELTVRGGQNRSLRSVRFRIP